MTRMSETEQLFALDAFLDELNEIEIEPISPELAAKARSALRDAPLSASASRTK